MIPWTFRLFFTTTVTVLAGWGLVIGTRPDPSSWSEAEVETLNSTLPERTGPGSSGEGITSTPARVRLPTSRIVQASRFSGPAEAALSVVALRLSVAGRILLVAAPFLASAFLLGLLFRERIRYGRGYASPTTAFLAKHLAAVSFVVGALFALTPLRLPYWTLYAAVSSTSLGLLLYVGNLPPKL